MSLEVQSGRLVLSYPSDEVGIWKVLRLLWFDGDLRTKQTWNVLAEQVRQLEGGRSRQELEQWIKEARALRAIDPEDERQQKDRLNRRLEALRSILSSAPPSRMSHDQNPLFDSSKTTNRSKANAEAQAGVSGQTAARIDSAIRLLKRPISSVPNLLNGKARYNPRYPTRHKGIRAPRPDAYARHQAAAQALAARASTSSKTSNAPSQQHTSDPSQGDEAQTLFIPEAPPSSIWATIRSNGGLNGRSQEASVRFAHPTATRVTSGRHAPDSNQSPGRRHLERSPRSPPQEDATEAKKKQRRKTRFDILPEDLDSLTERDHTHNTGYGEVRSQRSSSGSHLLRRE
ncbi:hypothetical protein PV05_04337 [Exophiala xenobiotica]|uniref:Uncharacterized protein n=1 Tax=Exophiala xenobiotica TaxID=348802 RepID=A0A0D2BT05_9EURO|nr:uncharacterized protein PV05_04337 [Exophiala xenobiotica]KIW55606.1 hypothetical protein PV05_04337 [Exophiala xenobiotica]